MTEPQVNVLSSRYSFERFIVGASNQFAHAACRAVADAPARSYNPLIVYGGAGLGKTHLLHAIGQYVMTHRPGLKLTYVSGERFAREAEKMIAADRLLEFRALYRSNDVLLMDDVSCLIAHDPVGMEFFHTVNVFHGAQKQIVLAGDGLLAHIHKLDERHWPPGMLADIQPPDLETRLAILKANAEADEIDLPDDVALFLAHRNPSNVRALQGALIRLGAYASLTRQTISMELATEVLRVQ